MTTSICLSQFQRNVNGIIFDKNFEKNSAETKLKEIFDRFKIQTERINHGEALLSEGEATFKRVISNLDEIAAFHQKKSQINPDKKV